MMRRIKQFFVVAAIFIAATILFLGIKENKAVVIHQSYSEVYLFGERSGAAHHWDRVTFEQKLDSFAKNRHSLIAKRIITPNQKSSPYFEYTYYGKLPPPPNMPLASQSSSDNSTQYSSYSIVKGSLSVEELFNFFMANGYDAGAAPASPAFALFQQMANGGPSVTLTFVVMLLAFLCFTIYLQIANMKKGSIELLSGLKNWQVASKVFWDDVKYILPLTTFVSVGLSLAMVFLASISNMNAIILSIKILFSIALILLLISFVTSLIFTVLLKYAKLNELLKGSLPIKSLIGFVLVVQFFVAIVLSMSFSNGFRVSQIIAEQTKQAKSWENYKQYFMLSTSFEVSGKSATDKELFHFLEDEVNREGALFVASNLYLTSTTNPKILGNNALYVTPNYLDLQNVKVDKDVKEKLNHLQQGEFGLILPDKFKAQKSEFTRIAKQNFQKNSGLNPNNITAIVAITNNSATRFLYNSTAESGTLQQSIVDPVIIVLNPTSMSTQSIPYWVENMFNFYTVDYQRTDTKIKQLGIEKYFLYIDNLENQFLKSSEDFIRAQNVEFANTIITVVVSILFFVTINMIYFAQFRREIWIKKISGLKFHKIHQNYLLIQLGVLLASFPLMVFITGNLPTSFVTLCSILIVSISTLVIQFSLETRASLGILKGK